MVCTTCSQVGHSSRQCPDTTICNRCNTLGHFARVTNQLLRSLSAAAVRSRVSCRVVSRRTVIKSPAIAVAWLDTLAGYTHAPHTPLHATFVELTRRVSCVCRVCCESRTAGGGSGRARRRLGASSGDAATGRPSWDSPPPPPRPAATGAARVGCPSAAAVTPPSWSTSRSSCAARPASSSASTAAGRDTSAPYVRSLRVCGRACAVSNDTQHTTRDTRHDTRRIVIWRVWRSWVAGRARRRGRACPRACGCRPTRSRT